jgi:hypothetical protein
MTCNSRLSRVCELPSYMLYVLCYISHISTARCCYLLSAVNPQQGNVRCVVVLRLALRTPPPPVSPPPAPSRRPPPARCAVRGALHVACQRPDAPPLLRAPPGAVICSSKRLGRVPLTPLLRNQT